MGPLELCLTNRNEAEFGGANYELRAAKIDIFYDFCKIIDGTTHSSYATKSVKNFPSDI